MMYVPPQFVIDDEECFSLIERFPLGALVTQGADGFVASHIPFVLDRRAGDKGVLRGHVARPNAQGREGVDGSPGLVIFQPAGAYVTPSLYPAKRDHGKVVPTWNYVAVHVSGTLAFPSDEAWLAAHLDQLTRHMEAGRDPEWAVSDAPEPYIAQLKRAIIGVELTISAITGAAKVVQHRSEGDKRAVHDDLMKSRDRGDRLMADYLARALKP
ncbi:MAG: FMN-binding negative transcriptional regulator [Hyphomicrobiales bacterium]|nr:FMN-binding negative transcriptional regulator [Hyphomicrobiales bacterium]